MQTLNCNEHATAIIINIPDIFYYSLIPLNSWLTFRIRLSQRGKIKVS